MIEYVIKRDGRKEAFDPEKLNSWGIWASKTIDPKVVNWSSVVLRTVSTLPKQVTTDELQKALIKSCIDMDTYEHNRMAGRLYADALPKQLYKDRKYPHIRDLHKEMSKKGLIRKDINYTDEEYDRINKMIKHKRDIGYTYYSSHHIMSKYAKKDHTTKKTYETPQFVYMRVAMQTFLNYQGEDRMEKLENLYTKLSTRKINIPTPYFANSLTSNPNVASCFLPGALVDTSTKRQAIATVEVGTEVLTHTGTYKKVIDKFSRKFTGKLVGLTTVASYPQDFECTYNHRIYAVKRTSAELAKQPDKSSPEWIEADHLRVGDYIKLGVDLKETPFNYTVWDIIKNNEEVSDYELIDNVIVKVGGCLNRDYPRVPNIELNHPDFFRLVGYYLAEGCITKPSVGSSHFDLTFGTKDEYFITDAKNICLNLFGLDLKEYPRTQDNSTKLTSYSKVLCALMLELCGTGFNTKFLTSPLMTAPRELQEELLVGIIRGDGCSTISGFKLSLANKELVYQLKNIALRLNLHISLNGGVPSERYRNRVPMCTLQINVDGASLFAEKVAKDIHKIRKNKSHPGLHILFRNDGVFARVRGIYSKEVDDVEVWDLTVEEDHSFVVNSLSVHNCSVLTTKDEAQSIGIGSLLAYSLTTSGAGLGLHLKTRSLGDAVRGGDIEHSGKVPYYRAYAHSIKSSKQGSRGGAGTMYFPFFDPEVITLLNLKNPLSVDSKRLRELDYALLVNKWFVRKAIKKEPVWLFSYKDNPELYELFYDKDPDAFGVAMEEFAQKHKKKVTEVNASEILAACLRQSVETGRVYMMFADEANRRSPYKEKIYSSNLCTEILLPTKPYGSIEDLSSSDVDKGTVAFCNLAGIVVDNIEDDTDYEDSCYYALLMIDEGINNALLPYESLNHSIRYYRSAGVGILGLAHLMAKNKLSYKSREGLTFIHNLAEKHAYYLYKSALRLGKERGNAECMDRTLFPEGWLPIDVMNPNLGDLCDTELKYDWETLRQEIVDNGGIRFSTVSTIPPSENCLAFDTKVRTDKGDMTLKEIFDGYVDTSLDEAMKDHSPLTGGKWYELNKPLKALTASGEYHTIPRIWLNGLVKPFKITLEDGTVVKATESHKFLTDRGWIPAYDLRVGDNIINITEE